jgi:hypothetical protein
VPRLWWVECSKAELTINRQPALDPSPQPRPAPTGRALIAQNAKRRGPCWMPIGGPDWTPIDRHIGLRRCLASAAISFQCRIQPGRCCSGARPSRALIQTRVSPQLPSNLDRVDAGLLPPCPFIADTMNLPVMDSTQRGSKFVADLPAEGTRLRGPRPRPRPAGAGWQRTPGAER